MPIFTANGDPSYPPGGYSNVPAGTSALNPLGATSYLANGYVFQDGQGPTWAAVVANGGPIVATNNAQNYPLSGVAVIPKTFLDGPSNTILFMESYAVCQGDAGVTGRAWTYDNGGTITQFSPLQMSFVSSNPVQGQPLLSNAICYRNQGFLEAGIGVSMGDGSTRLVNSGVSWGTWGKLLCPNDGVPVPNDWQ